MVHYNLLLFLIVIIMMIQCKQMISHFFLFELQLGWVFTTGKSSDHSYSK